MVLIKELNMKKNDIETISNSVVLEICCPGTEVKTFFFKGCLNYTCFEKVSRYNIGCYPMINNPDINSVRNFLDICIRELMF
jgi:hypothetical protein